MAKEKTEKRFLVRKGETTGMLTQTNIIVDEAIAKSDMTDGIRRFCWTQLSL